MTCVPQVEAKVALGCWMLPCVSCVLDSYLSPLSYGRAFGTAWKCVTFAITRQYQTPGSLPHATVSQFTHCEAIKTLYELKN